MRVTPSLLQRMLLADLDRARQRLATTQERASSGLRVNRPSDDPVAAGEAVTLRANLGNVAQLGRNVARAEARLLTADRARATSVDVLVRARELAIQGANETNDAESRRLIAEEVAALHGELLSTGNENAAGSYLFSGYASSTPAFSASGPFVIGQPPPTVTFDADPNELQIEVDDGVMVETTFDGQRVFLGDGDGDGNPDAGREDLFQVLSDLWDALQTDDTAAIQASLSRIDAGQEQLAVERARAGGRLTRIEGARDALASREVEIQSRLSQVQDADTARVLSDLVQQETLLRASLEATARAIQPKLLDFLA